MRTLILILFYSVLVVSFSPPYFHSPINLYIADNNSTHIYRQHSQNQQIIGILFTNKQCRQCQQSQGQMVEIISKVWRLLKVKIYRCQLGLNPVLQQQFNIKRFPMLHFVIPKQDHYFLFQNYRIVTLEESYEIVAKLKQTFAKEKPATKEDNIYIDIDSLFFLEEEELLLRYTFNPVYVNVGRIILSPSNALEGLLKKEGIEKSQMKECKMYLKRNKRCFNPASIHEVAYILSFLNYQSVIQFTESTYRAYQQLELNRYVFVAVLDSIIKRAASQQYLTILNRILRRKQIQGKITIFWMETQINRQKLTHLGFKQHHHPPLFCKFDLSTAPKQILVNSKKQPIFDEESIINFIKKMINFDQEEELSRYNYEIFKQSLTRLKIQNNYQLLDSHKQANSQSYFMLSFPFVAFQLLADPQVFYKMILNYRYLLERINRFYHTKLQTNYFIFHKFKCGDISSFGLFYISQAKCSLITPNIVFEMEEVNRKIQSIFNLPELFWVNEDYYQSYVKQNGVPSHKFQYIYIDP